MGTGCRRLHNPHIQRRSGCDIVQYIPGNKASDIIGIIRGQRSDKQSQIIATDPLLTVHQCNLPAGGGVVSSKDVISTFTLDSPLFAM